MDAIPTKYQFYTTINKSSNDTIAPVSPPPTKTVNADYGKIPAHMKEDEYIKKAFAEDLELFYKDTVSFISAEINHWKENPEDMKRYKIQILSTQEQLIDDDYSDNYNFRNKMLLAVDDGKVHHLQYTNVTALEDIPMNPYKKFGFEPVFKRIQRELTEKGYSVRIKKQDSCFSNYYLNAVNYYLVFW
jgi:hypothetical protein